jgi:hypothetical protein
MPLTLETMEHVDSAHAKHNSHGCIIFHEEEIHVLEPPLPKIMSIGVRGEAFKIFNTTR